MPVQHSLCLSQLRARLWICICMWRSEDVAKVAVSTFNALLKQQHDARVRVQNGASFLGNITSILQVQQQEVAHLLSGPTPVPTPVPALPAGRRLQQTQVSFHGLRARQSFSRGCIICNGAEQLHPHAACLWM